MGAWAVWVSPRTSAILVNASTSLQSAKGLIEEDYKSNGVVTKKYTLSQSHHWLHCSETVVPIATHNNNSSLRNHIAVSLFSPSKEKSKGKGWNAKLTVNPIGLKFFWGGM